MVSLAASVLEQTELPPAPKLLLAIMALMADERGICHVPLGALAARLNLTLSSTSAHLKSLSKTGHIRLIRAGGGRHRPNAYEVTP